MLNTLSWHWLLKIGTCLLLAFLSIQSVDESSIKGDATQNLKIIRNLYFYGEYSLHNDGENGPPTNFREPVPPALTALYLKLALPHAQPDQFWDWHHGPEARVIKQVNAFWVFWGLLAFLELALLLIRQRWLALLAFAASFVFFFGIPEVTNTLYTELPAASLMLLGTCMTALALLSPEKALWKAILAGLLLGALCLTKTVFLVGAPAYIALLGWTQLWQRSHPWTLSYPWRKLTAMAVAFAAAIVPWMVRNKIQLDTYEISSGRSGYVTLFRGYMDLMNDDEFRLGFTLYGPSLYKRAVKGTSLELLPDDYQRGGRVQRLNYGAHDFVKEDRTSVFTRRPDQSLTFYTKPAAEFQVLLQDLRDKGVERADLAADKILKAKAMSIFKEHPLKHLKVSALVLWSEFWILGSHAFATQWPVGPAMLDVLTIINAVIGISLLIGFAIAIVRRDLLLALMTGLPGSLIVLHALLTQGLSRLNVPVLPFMVLAFFVLLGRLIANIATSLRVSSDGAGHGT